MSPCSKILQAEPSAHCRVRSSKVGAAIITTIIIAIIVVIYYTSNSSSSGGSFSDSWHHVKFSGTR